MRGMLTVTYGAGVWALASVLAALRGYNSLESTAIGVVSVVVVFSFLSFGYRARHDHTEVRQ